MTGYPQHPGLWESGPRRIKELKRGIVQLARLVVSVDCIRPGVVLGFIEVSSCSKRGSRQEVDLALDVLADLCIDLGRDAEIEALQHLLDQQWGELRSRRLERAHPASHGWRRQAVRLPGSIALV